MPPPPRPKRPSPKKNKNTLLSSPNKRLPPPLHKTKQVELGGAEELHLTENEINSFLHPTMNELRNSVKLGSGGSSRYNQVDVDASIYRAVVGYLGTIEMPKESSLSGGNSNSLGAIGSCIRRLRVEKKVHTMVLMCIFNKNIVLVNHHGLKLAEYPSDQITFCGTCADDKRFFGLVTVRRSSEDEGDTSSSCHVFMTEAVNSKAEAERRARAFQFSLTFLDENQTRCKEFPAVADPIIQVVMAVYGHKTPSSSGAAPNGPTSSNSSNGDSGIFRDDAAAGGAAAASMQADKASQKVHPQSRSLDSSPQKLDIRAMPLPRPSTAASSGDDSFNTERLDEQSSAQSLRQSMHKYLQSKQQHLKMVSEQLSTNSRTRSGGAWAEATSAIGPNAKYADDQGSVKSLEDEMRGGEETRFSLRSNHSVPPTTGLVSAVRPGPIVSSSEPSPLEKYLYNSESNLSQLSAAEAALSLVSKSETQSAVKSSTILRPGEQYPSEPGVLRSTPPTQPHQHQQHFQLHHAAFIRPVSSQSGRSESGISQEGYPTEDQVGKRSLTDSGPPPFKPSHKGFRILTVGLVMPSADCVCVCGRAREERERRAGTDRHLLRVFVTCP